MKRRNFLTVLAAALVAPFLWTRNLFASQAITFEGFALSGTTDTTTLNITLPTNVTVGDIMLLEYTHRGSGAGTIGGAGGSGWNNKESSTYAAGTFSHHLYWKRCDGSESGDALTVTGLTNSCAGCVTLYRGCVTSGDPIETFLHEENASGNETMAQITTSTNGAWVVLTVANSPDVAVTSPSTTSPGALTLRAERLNTSGTDTAICHNSAVKASAGATGALTWAQTNGASSSRAYALTPDTGATTLYTNLVAYWELEEASGDRVDSHGSNDLTPTNTPGNAAGKVGNALDLEFGSSQHLSRTDTTELSVGNIDFTFAVWVNVESTDAVNVFHKGDSDDISYQLQFLAGPNRFRFRVSSGTALANLTGISSAGTINLATWYFVVVWHDAAADTLNMQINNGTPETPIAYTFGSYDEALPFYVGVFANGFDWFDGLIDQLGFWKRVLTSDERTALYNSGNGLSYAGLAGTPPATDPANRALLGVGV